MATPLGDQVFVDHFGQAVAGHVFGVAAVAHAQRVQVRLAAELHDALGDLVRMGLFLVGVLEEFLLDGLAGHAAGP